MPTGKAKEGAVLHIIWSDGVETSLCRPSLKKGFGEGQSGKVAKVSLGAVPAACPTSGGMSDFHLTRS
jgi:hypothetical protein